MVTTLISLAFFADKNKLPPSLTGSKLQRNIRFLSIIISQQDGGRIGAIDIRRNVNCSRYTYILLEIEGVLTGNYLVRRRSSSRTWSACRSPSRRKFPPQPGRCRKSKSARDRGQSPWYASRVCRSPLGRLCSPDASRDNDSIERLCTS